jgi:peptidoglycan/LPS O-acetylase OafA/YrhL
MTTDNLYQAPEAPLLSQDEPEEALQLFTTQRRKMIILSVCTLNMYSVYWFYKHWTAQRINGGRDCIPVLRAIFQIFFVFSLFSTIKYDAEFKKLAVAWSAGWLAAFYILCTIAGSIIERFGDNTQNLSSYTLISLVCYLLPIIPLVLVQQTANELNGDPKGLKNATLSWQNWIFIILGILWWLLVMVGLFLPSA